MLKLIARSRAIKREIHGLHCLGRGYPRGRSGRSHLQGSPENRDRDAKTLREANRRKLEIISGISGAITGMRELKDISLTYCAKGMIPEQKQDMKANKVKQRFELIKIARPRLHFFNETFRTLLIREFLIWEDSIIDYCDPTAQSEAEGGKNRRRLKIKWFFHRLKYLPMANIGISNRLKDLSKEVLDTSYSTDSLFKRSNSTIIFFILSTILMFTNHLKIF